MSWTTVVHNGDRKGESNRLGGLSKLFGRERMCRGQFSGRLGRSFAVHSCVRRAGSRNVRCRGG